MVVCLKSSKNSHRIAKQFLRHYRFLSQRSCRLSRDRHQLSPQCHPSTEVRCVYFLTPNCAPCLRNAQPATRIQNPEPRKSLKKLIAPRAPTKLKNTKIKIPENYFFSGIFLVFSEFFSRNLGSGPGGNFEFFSRDFWLGGLDPCSWPGVSQPYVLCSWIPEPWH